jgi:hypothetical protein
MDGERISDTEVREDQGHGKRSGNKHRALRIAGET